MIRPQIAMWTAFLLGVVMSSAAMAVPNLNAPSTHQGKVNGIGKSEIMVTDLKDGEIETFKVSSETKITLDGQPAKLVDIQVGFLVEIAADMGQDGKLTAKSISASSKLPPSAPSMVTSRLE